jgi:hypothetical protein
LAQLLLQNNKTKLHQKNNKKVNKTSHLSEKEREYVHFKVVKRSQNSIKSHTLRNTLIFDPPYLLFHDASARKLYGFELLKYSGLF